MVKAVIHNRVIVPREPLPADWDEGTEVEVNKAATPVQSTDSLDRWFAELEAIAAEGDPEDDARLDAAIQEIRREGKERARKQLGIPE